MEMAGIAFRGGTSCSVRFRPPPALIGHPWPLTRLRFARSKLRCGARHLLIKNKKTSQREVFCFWRWRESFPVGGTSRRPPSRAQRLTVPSMAPFPRFRSAPFHVRFPPKNKKTSQREVFCFWRWRESNPRPEEGARGVYRCSDARWLSGPGGSTASVGSVPRLKSQPPFGSGGKQALVGVRSSYRSERHSTASALCYLRSESETVVRFGSYKFLPNQEIGTPPAAQDRGRPSRNRCTPGTMQTVCAPFGYSLSSP